MKFAVVIVILMCLMELSSAKRGPPSISSRARRVKHIGEWLTRNNSDTITRDPSTLKYNSGRRYNFAPIGSKLNPDVKLAPHPYLSKPIVKYEPKTITEYLHKREHEPRVAVRDRSMSFKTSDAIPTGP